MSDRPDLTRRQFCQTSGALAGGLLRAAGAAAPAPLPRRALGRSGVELPILGLGTACAGQSHGVSFDEAVTVYRAALDEGITFFDAARGYDKAERALREALGTRREEVFLTTKAGGPGAAAMRQSFETSLRELGTDHVDLLYWHHAGGYRQEGVLDPDGAFDYLQREKQAGRARWIGFTSHSHPTAVATLLQHGVVDAVMVVLNLADRWLYDFESKLLPAARAHGAGVLAMKVYGGVRGNHWGRYGEPPQPSHVPTEHLPLALRYALSLPGVTAAVVGCHSVEQVRQNAAWARGFQPLSATEQEQAAQLGRQLAAGWQPRFGPTG
ncbi:MAG: aldo/keto reductase [Fimbriimonadaceae bacterium]|nr:aldo/keto reductase [Fimbriimonadaceae bacterium]